MATNGAQKGLVFSKLVSVSSSSSDPTQSTTNFTFNAGSTLQQILKVSINNVTFYNNIYNIYNDSRGQNNTYTYSFNSVPFQYTLPPGFYSIAQIINLLNADLVINTGTTASWSFNTTTNKVALTILGPNSFQLNPGNNPPLGLMTTMGGLPFTASTIYGGGFPITLTGTTFPLLGGPTIVYLRSSALAPSNSIERAGTFANTLLSFPITAAPLALNVFECKVDSLCEISYSLPRNLNQIDITLTDRDGNILDLHGGTLNIELRVWYNVF